MKFRLAMLFMFVSVFAFSNALTVAAQESQYGVPAPTILDVQKRNAYPGKPLITGVTFNDTLVDVYIDGVFNGKATVANGPEGVASFAYEPFLVLTPGEHTVFTVARSLDQTVRSKESVYKSFSIAKHVIQDVPAPVLLDPTIGANGQMTIVGLIKNDLQIKIYIEGVLQAAFTPPTSKTGTTNFWFRPHLEPGEYTITARAQDEYGNISIVSQEKTLFVPTQPESVVDDTTSEHQEDSMVEVQDDQIETPEEVDVIEETSEDTVTTDEEVQEDQSYDNMQDIEEALGDKPVVVDVDDQTNVTVHEDAEQGEVTISDTTEETDIVIDSDAGDELALVDTNEQGAMTQDDEMDGAMTEEGIEEGVEEIGLQEQGIEEDVQERNRTAGFILLLVIAIVLAVWYVREKRQLDRKKQAKDDKSKQDTKLQQPQQQSFDQQREQQNQHQDQNNQNSQKKKKKKKKRR